MKKELKRIEQIYKDLSEPNEVGEDGDMVCRATTEKGALLKFKRWVKDVVGESEADELSLENISICYLFEVDDEFRKEFENNSDALECEWYVNAKEISDMPLYRYSY